MVPQQQRRRRRRAAIPRTPERRLIVERGAGGFGFTIAGQRPCVVSAVAAGGPAERAGLRAGDALLGVDGASVARAPHASVARLVAGAPGAIALSVAPRDVPPTDTEDTEPEERARTRRRHPPPRRRPQAAVHHPACQVAPSTSGVNEILQHLSRAQLTREHAARLECRAVVGYLRTIETPQASPKEAPTNVRNAVRKLRQERRPAASVLLSVLPNSLLLRRPNGEVLAQYQRERILYAGCASDADRRYFGLVTSAESTEITYNSCHVFAVDPRMAEHEAHINRAREFQITCTRDPVAERCLEFPPSAEYVVGIIRGMYSLPADDCSSPSLLQISKIAVKGDSPGVGNFSRANRAVFRMPRERRCRHEERVDGQVVANSPQPSNHSEITTTSSNSDSGIGFNNDCRNIADRILVVDFAQQPVQQRFRQEIPRRPMGMVGCSFEDGSFLSNTTPVVDGFGGQGRPLNLDDVMINNDLQTVHHASPRKDDDYNYNVYGNIPSSSKTNGVYDQVYTENEGQYEVLPQDLDLEIDPVDNFNSVELYEEEIKPDYHSNESVENITVISGGTSKASMDSVSMYSSRSHEEARPSRTRYMQASLDDMLMLGQRDEKDEGHFVHPASVKCKVRKSKPLNLLSKTKHMLSGKEKEKRRRALSSGGGEKREVERDANCAASEPDLREGRSEQTSPFRRWTTSGGAGSSYRHHDPRNIYNKMSEGTPQCIGSSSVARWSLGLEQLLADPAGAAAFSHFLTKEFAAENIRFWRSCEEYSSADPSRRAALARQIFQRHLASNASDPVNVDAAARRSVEERMAPSPPPADLFQQAQSQIFNVMKFDSYPRFLRSAPHAAAARAELMGMPQTHQPTSPSLKKSASNLSDRRRSGAALFRFRAASRDRSDATDTDVVKSSQTALGQCSLCRVELPDGATSVVPVDAACSVAELVSRLLQRRHIVCDNYDVVLNNANEGEPSTVDPTSPSTLLSGREVRVERRCVVRVCIASRCVSVRCGATRHLRHVLQPLARRYHVPHHYTVVMAGRALHADVTMQELDGARIQIVPAAECPEAVTDEARTQDPGDDDSLSQLASRMCDDNVSQQSSSTSRSASSATSGAPSGRVRAALHAGPPLHHHPPDFLEKLRETQRQRLLAPPPLPPKPAPRTAPTVV